MFPEKFRDQGGAGGNVDSTTQKPAAGTQDGKVADPVKGLSAEQLAELETLRKEKVTLEKRLSDTQTSFHDKTREVSDYQKKLKAIEDAQSKPKAEEQDPKIRQIDTQIAKFKEQDLDYGFLEVVRAQIIENNQTREELKKVQSFNQQGMEMGKILNIDKNFNDFEAIVKVQNEAAANGEKISMVDAFHRFRSNNQEAIINERAEKIANEKLEILKKGQGARGQDGENPPEPKPEDKEMRDFASQLTGGISGVEIK